VGHHEFHPAFSANACGVTSQAPTDWDFAGESHRPDAAGRGARARRQPAAQPRAQRILRRDPPPHTSWSVDAWVKGNRLTGPGDALKYAQGQTIKHLLGYDITIDTPLDFSWA